MKNKLLSRALAVMVTALFFGMLLAPVISLAAGHIRPVGKTTLQSSQLVLWYDQDREDEDFQSFLQVTNASVDTPVWVHVQIFASSNPDDGNPLTAVFCLETDFNDFYTPNDTHIYDMDDLFTNDPLNSIFIGNFSNPSSKGFVIVTPIDAPGTRNAIAHQHMFGTTYALNNDDSVSYFVSAMGRDAVSFNTGSVVADGTELDGTSNGYVLIQPELLIFNYAATDRDINSADIVSIAFRDNYSGVFGYVAEPADATWTPLIFDDEENPISCGTITQNCFFNIGLNEEYEAQNELLDTNLLLCPGNNFDADGFVKIAVGGLDGLENELGLVLLTETDGEQSFGNWMYAQ